MAVFNYANREITAKIVYYGPGLCGKTTNLEYIHKKVDPKGRGQMLSLATETDRTLFFDLLPVDLGTISGFNIRIQLFTVPGQTYYNATRKIVLRGADGVVFVADSQEKQFESNLESWNNLEENLAINGLDINTVPLALQFNKQDLPPLTPHEKLNEALNPLNAPVVKAVAVTGEGVLETFKIISRKVLEGLKGQIGRSVTPAAPRPSPPPQAGPARVKITSEKTHAATAAGGVDKEASLAHHNVKSPTRAVESWSNLGQNHGGLPGSNGADTMELITTIKRNLVSIIEANRNLNMQYEDLSRLMDKLAHKLNSGKKG